jgi:type IV secretion system protein VirB4
MLRLDKVIKPWKESASLNDHINLYGFWNETAFLTKSGDLGMVLSVPGVDYESLDRSEQEYAVKRLEAALKAFGPGFHVYQYLFKSNRPDIPFAKYDDPIVEAAIEQRRKFFEAKRDHLYQIEIVYCILLEGARSKTGVSAAIARILRDPAGAVGELKVQFTNDSMKTLLRTHIEHDLRRLDQSVQAFARQLADFMQIEILNQQGQFTFFRRLLNYDDWRVAGKPQSTQFLDYQVVNSDIEAERDHLRVGDHIVRVLTMKEAITETRPLALDALLKIPANFYAVTEWTPLPADKARKEVNKRRRHFNMSKTGFVSQMGNDATKTNPRDVLVDESKQADIENLGDCLRARSRVHWHLHQRGWQPVCGDLQPAQRLFRYRSGQLCAQPPQTVSAEHKLCRPVFPLYDPYRREDERASRHRISGCARNRQQHALLSQPAHRRRCPHPYSRDER